MSIFDTLFGKNPPNTDKQAAPAAHAETSIEGKTADQTMGQNNGEKKQEEKSPLAQFDGLWQPEVDAEGKPISKSDTAFSIDPKRLQEHATKMNFTKDITPEQLAAMSAGGEAGVKVMMELINKTGQQAFAQASFASSKLIDEALKGARGSLDSDLPAMLRKLQANEKLQNKNPIFKHSAVAPMMEALQSQMAKKFPSASAEELTKMTEDFITALSGGVKDAAKDVQTETGKDKGNTDFTSFFA